MEIHYVVDVEQDNGHSLVITGSTTYDGAVFEGRKMAQYYVNDLGYNVKLKISEACPVCYNRGYVFKPQKRNKFIGKNLVCPNCRGKIPNQTWIVEYKELEIL